MHTYVAGRRACIHYYSRIYQRRCWPINCWLWNLVNRIWLRQPMSVVYAIYNLPVLKKLSIGLNYWINVEIKSGVDISESWWQFNGFLPKGWARLFRKTFGRRLSLCYLFFCGPGTISEEPRDSEFSHSRPHRKLKQFGCAAHMEFSTTLSVHIEQKIDFKDMMPSQ